MRRIQKRLQNRAKNVHYPTMLPLAQVAMRLSQILVVMHYNFAAELTSSDANVQLCDYHQTTMRLDKRQKYAIMVLISRAACPQVVY